MNYEGLIKALRCCAENFGCPIECPRYSPADEGVRACVSRLEKDAAAAIEELQAEVKILKVSGREAYFEGLAADANGRQVEKLAKRNAELHAELEKWVSAAEKAGDSMRSEWVRVEDEESYHYECSRCGERPLYSRFGDVVLSGVCPMCGAKMEVQDDKA